MVSQYERGREFERELVRRMKKSGLIVIRSAGSKSIIDIVVLDQINGRIFMIQCKRSRKKTGTVGTKKFNRHLVDLKEIADRKFYEMIPVLAIKMDRDREYFYNHFGTELNMEQSAVFSKRRY